MSKNADERTELLLLHGSDKGRKSESLIKPIILWHSFQHAHMTCPCGEEATEKYSQILSHFEEVYAILALVGMGVFSGTEITDGWNGQSYW